MDPACLEYCLTDEERDEFEQNGFFIVEDVLPPRLIEELSAVVDRLDAEYRPKMELGPYERMNLLDFVGKDEIFLELLAHDGDAGRALGGAAAEEAPGLAPGQRAPQPGDGD
jgi:ectoine hydroxylase